MIQDELLRAILPEVLMDNFEIVNFKKTSTQFDIWLDEKKELSDEVGKNKEIISNGFGDYHTIIDFPIRGRITNLHVRRRKWLNLKTREIFSISIDISAYDKTRLNKEFVAFLKEGD